MPSVFNTYSFALTLGVAPIATNPLESAFIDEFPRVEVPVHLGMVPEVPLPVTVWALANTADNTRTIVVPTILEIFRFMIRLLKSMWTPISARSLKETQTEEGLTIEGFFL